PGKEGLASKERVLCLDAQTGKPIWAHEYDCTYKIYYPSGPRTTPVVQGDRVYTLGSMGDLCCLKSADGAVVWSRNLLTDYKTKPPIWGYAAHLLVEGDFVFTLVGGENTAVVALDRNTGKGRWHALTVQEVGYAPPMMIEAGGQGPLAGQEPRCLQAGRFACAPVYARGAGWLHLRHRCLWRAALSEGRHRRGCLGNLRRHDGQESDLRHRLSGAAGRPLLPL